MSKIIDYTRDLNVTGVEKLIGSDDGGKTVNLRLSDIANYLARGGHADNVGDSFSWERKTTLDNNNAQGTFAVIVDDAISSDSIDASDLVKLRVAEYALRGSDVLPLMSKWVDSIIRIGISGGTDYALFILDNVAELTDENSSFLEIDIRYDSGDADLVFTDDAQITISDVATSRVGGGNILSGETTPNASLGNSGDIYFQIDEDNDNVMVFGPKAGGAWGDGVNLIGATGAMGEQGDPGADGLDGADGISAYQIWLNQGHSGTENDFLNSLIGAQGSKGDQGDQGIYISSITSDDAGAGNNTTVTVGFSDPSGNTAPADQTFTVAPGANGEAGFLSKAKAEEADSDDLDITGVDTISGGNNVTIEIVGNELVINAIGGGGAGYEEPSISLSRSGFVADDFSGDKSITYNATVNVGNGNTITSVVFSTSDGGFSDITDTTSPYSSGTTQTNFADHNGSVTVTATLNYKTTDDDANRTKTASTTMTLNKSLPSQQAFITGNSGFEYTPANRQVEMFDAGNFTTRTSFTGSLNSWHIVGNLTYNPTDASDGTWTVTSTDTDLDLIVTANLSQSSDGTGDTYNGRTLNTNADHYSRIRSVRIGGTTNSSFTQTAVEALSNWGTDLKFGTITPNGNTFTVSTSAGERIYILYDASLGDITKIVDGNNNTVTNQYTKGTDVAGMKFYLQDTAGAALTDYELTITL